MKVNGKHVGVAFKAKKISRPIYLDDENCPSMVLVIAVLLQSFSLQLLG
jgi:hypothetical protein